MSTPFFTWCYLNVNLLNAMGLIIMSDFNLKFVKSQLNLFLIYFEKTL